MPYPNPPFLSPRDQECLRLDPAWAKGHFRLGSAQQALGQYAEAYASFQRCADTEEDVAAGILAKTMQQLVVR
jgi:tetratricopeptide (TPR) repeat protein